MAIPRVFVACSFLPERDVLDLAVAIEQHGYDGLGLPDHLFMAHTMPGEYPYSDDGHPPFPLDAPWPDVFATTSAIGTLTNLSIVTTVFVLPLRHPLIVAKAAATAAIITEGRFNLGIGVGWQREEFDALGVDYTRRGAIANESIEVLRKAWQKGPVEHQGEFFSFGPMLMEPVPPRIPILVGGSSDAALRRAAKLGDGWLAPIMPLEEVPGCIDRLNAELQAAGRDRSDFEVMVPTLVGSIDQLRPIVALGVDSIVVVPWLAAGPKPTSVAEKIEYLGSYAADVIEPLRAGAAASA
jgi:probable F420-dependent oxidoreductase